MEKQYLIEIIEQTIDMVNSIKKPENKTKAIVNAADRIISNSTPLPEQPVSPLPTVIQMNEVFDSHCPDDGYFLMNRRQFRAAILALYEPKQEEAKERYKKAIQYYMDDVIRADIDSKSGSMIANIARIASGYTPPESNLTDKT